MRILGEATVARFSNRHSEARKSLQRFLMVARTADWPHFPAVKATFPATDLGRQSGRLIFDIDENKYRLIASVDFKEQLLLIEHVLTHEAHDREAL